MAKRSKRHRQEEPVELQGEEMFRIVFEQCPDAIFLADADTGAILNVNPAGCELMAMPREELLGLHHTSLHPKEEAERYEAIFKEHAQQSGATAEDLYIRRPSGELVPVDVSSSVMEISGRPIVQSVFRDITSRKQAEDALRDSERRYRRLVELSFDGIAMHSGGKIVSANSALATLLGAEDPEELLGRTITEFLPPEYHEVVAARVAQVGEGGEAPLYEERFRRLDGTVVDVEVGAVPATHEGQPAAQVVVRDITARKWAAEALRESEERYRSLFNSLPLGLGLSTAEGQVVMHNEAMHEFTGYTTADLSRMNARDMYLNRGDRDLLVERLERDGFVRDFETELKRKDGTAFHANLTVSLCTLDGREVILTALEDITERREMEDELSKLSRAVEQSPSTVVITDTEGTIEYVNPRFTEITGYSQEDVIGQNPRLLKSGMQSADFYEELWRTIKDGAVWRGEFVNKKKDGELYWERAAISPVKDSQGSITDFVKVAEDITEQKQAEQALRDSEERYRRIVEDMPALVCRFLPHGTLTFVNEHYCRYFHKRREELEGHNFFEFVPEEVHEEVRGRFSSLTPESPTITYEHQVLTPDGTLRWQRWTDRALFSEEGRAVEYQSIGQDITERKQAREALEESEQKFRSLAEQSPNMIFINKDGAVVYANERCQEVMGYTREEFYCPDFDFFSLVAPESRDSISENYARHLRGEEVSPVECTLVTKEGERIEAILATRLIAYEGQNAILGVVTDVTERKRAEEALQESEERFRSIVESAPSLLFIIDQEGNNLYVSPNCEEIVGYTQQELQGGHKWWVHEDDTPRAREVFDRTFREEVGLRNFEYKAVKKSGEVWHASSSWEVLRDREGQFAAVVLQTIDITERKRAEEELRRYAHELAVRVKELNCLYAISALVQMPGVTLEEILQGVVELIPPGWGHPEITCARLAIDGQEYRTDNFEETAWAETADILIGGERTGTLEVGLLEERPVSEEGPFEQQEGFLIDAIAERVGRIIERMRAEEALRQSTRELTIRNQIARVFLTTTDEEMYGDVMEVILEALESRYGVFGYLDEDGALVCASMTKDIWDKCQIPDKEIIFPRHTWGGIWGRALVEKKSLYANEGLEVPEGHVPISRALDVPIIHQGEVIGNLTVANKPTDYDDEDLGSLEAIARYMAPILSARLLRRREESQRRRAEEALRQSTRELALRNQIARVFLTSTDEEMYGDVLEVILEALESEYGVFGYIDEDGALICASMTKDIWDKCQIPDKDIVFPRETWGGIWGRALIEAKSFYSNGPMHVPEGHVPIERAVAVPILHQGEPIGILEAANKDTDYDERDQELLEAIAGYIAPVLQARWEGDRQERERRRAEEALRESEERFRTMYSQSPIAVELYDGEGKLIDANPACLDFFGVDSEEELRGFDLFEDPNMPSDARAHIERGEAVAYENVFDFDLVTREGLYRTSKSGTRVIDVRITPLKGAEGVLGGFLVHVQDITERKTAEEELEETTRLLETILDHSHVLVAYMDPEFNFVRVNRVYAEADGRDPSFFPGRNHFDLYPDEENQAVFQRVLETREPFVAYARPFEYEEHPERGVTYWDWTLVPITEDDGTVTGLVLTVADVTERIRAQKELWESEERYRDLVESIDDVIYAVDADGVVTYVSPSIEAFGYTASEIMDHTFGEFMVPEDLQSAEEAVQRLFSGHSVGENEYRILSKSGDARWVRVSSRPVLTDDRVVGVRGVLSDITERKRAEQALWESEEKYRHLVESIDDVIYGTDPSGELTYVSPVVETVFGYPPSEVIGRSFAEFLSPEDLQSAGESFQQLLSGESVGPMEYRILTKSGQTRWVRFSSRPVVMDDGLVGVRGVLSDITERKRAEEDATYERDLMRTLLENVPDYVYFKDRDRRFVRASTSFCDLFKCSLEEIIGKKDEELFPQEVAEETANDDRYVIETGTPLINKEEGSDSIGGEERWVLTTKLPWYDMDGNIVGLFGVSREITDRRRAEQEALRAKEAAETARREEQERRQEAERRRQIAESLSDVMTVLNSNQSLDEVLDYIAMRTAELLGNQAVGIYRLEDDQKLAIQAARGLLVAYATGREIPVGHEALRRAMASREAVPVPRLARRLTADRTPTGEALQETLARTWGDLYLALLAVPIIAGEELYGAIALYYSEPREFPQEEIELATVFGDQVALAIENARLRDQVREAAAVAERERLARDLHDAVTQTLFSASLIAEALPRVWERDQDRAREGLNELRSLTQGALAEMRTLLLELRPAGLTEKALGELLGHLTQAMTGRSRVPISLTVEGDSHLPDELQIALYRIAQEALNNIVRHAEANQVSVWLHCEPELLRLRIRDDGCGFDPEDTLPDQLGMGIMRERAKSVGATLEITSQPGQGTEVAVDWQEANGRPSDD